MNYGDALNWCVKHNAVFRFVNRNERPSFVAMNETISGDKALELAITLDGKTVAGHAPLDSSTEPSKAVARALITCVEYFVKRESAMLTGALN